MQPYRTIITVDNPNQIILNNVPVQPGDRVEIVVRPHSKPRGEVTDRMKKLLRKTHSLPQLENISVEEIADEVAAYRHGK